MNFNSLLILNYSSNFNLFITALWISHSILAHYTFFSIGTFYSKKGNRVVSTFGLSNPIYFIFIFVFIFINIGLPIGFNFIVEGAGLCGIIVSKTNLLFFMLVIFNSIILVSLFIVMSRVYSLKSFYYDFTFNEIQVVCFSLFIIILLV